MNFFPISLYLPSQAKLWCTLQLRGQRHIPLFLLYPYLYSVEVIENSERRCTVLCTHPYFSLILSGITKETNRIGYGSGSLDSLIPCFIKKDNVQSFFKSNYETNRHKLAIMKLSIVFKIIPGPLEICKQNMFPWLINDKKIL